MIMKTMPLSGFWNRNSYNRRNFLESYFIHDITLRSRSKAEVDSDDECDDVDDDVEDDDEAEDAELDDFIDPEDWRLN